MGASARGRLRRRTLRVPVRPQLCMAECGTARVRVREEGCLVCEVPRACRYETSGMCGNPGRQCFMCAGVTLGVCVWPSVSPRVRFRGEGCLAGKTPLVCADETAGVCGRAQCVSVWVCRCDLRYVHLTGCVTACACQKGRMYCMCDTTYMCR